MKEQGAVAQGNGPLMLRTDVTVPNRRLCIAIGDLRQTFHINMKKMKGGGLHTPVLWDILINKNE